MPEQAGFTQFRSVENQMTYISQMIEDGFQGKRHSVAVRIDMEKAFGKVWTDELLNKLTSINISHKMLHWIRGYLKNRQALVKTNGINNKTEYLQNGVPKGGALSPTLFLIFTNDIQKQISKTVYPSLYADDLALLCTAKARVQTTLNIINKWTAD